MDSPKSCFPLFKGYVIQGSKWKATKAVSLLGVYCPGKQMESHNRVRTEIGYQNSRTFPGLFKDYLHFFQESFFIDSNSPNTAYTQDFCSSQDRKRISLSRSLVLPDFNSSYRLRMLLSFLPFPISGLRCFASGCIRFVLLESNRIE